MYDWETATLTAAADQPGGFIFDSCEGLKVNWDRVSGANFRGGFRVQDCADTVLNKCVFNAYSGSVDVYFSGGATLGNSNIGEYVAFDQV